MKKLSFNDRWEFTLENNLDEFNTFGFDKYSDAAGAASRFYDHNNWERIDLPHDWTVTLKKDVEANPDAGGYPNTRYHRFMAERHSEVKEVYHIGWYRKQFFMDQAWEGKRIFVEFEGIFRDAIIWVNGVYLDRHNSGYTSFAIEITDHLLYGEENSIAVRVDSEHAEGWWYEGAGIYRNVNFLIGEPVYLKYNQTVVKSQVNGQVDASAVLVNDTSETVEKDVAWCIEDANGNAVACAESRIAIAPYSEMAVEIEMKVNAPKLWSVDTPYLYTLKIQAGAEQTSVRFGIRSVAFDAERGFLLNGESIKVRGACVHQDFGGVGVALTDNLQYYKIKRLKEMGVNAYRCSHHAPSPVLLDACDELGMLVMDETRTFGTSPEAIRQLTDLIERDRNHPCVFIWSLGNEEHSVQNVEWSYRLMEKATRIAKKLDPTRPVTYGGNNGSNFIGVNGATEIRGINYIRNDKDGHWLDNYHADHPEQPIIGTEESSYVLSRGCAVNDLGNGMIDSMGTVTMPWGSTPKGWVKFMEERDYFAGSFMWTGFDYRGEPNPFYYTNTVSSFGTIDLCGMEKPPFYYYKAWWTDEPVLKLAPHWNHKKGDTVTVAVFTNCEEITLSLNGRALETRLVERFDSPLFSVPFEAGVLSVEGKRGDKILHDELVTSGKIARVTCTPVWEAQSDADTAIYQIDAYDENGVFCPLAAEELLLDIENGSIVGVGNGDPASMDAEQLAREEEYLFVRSFNSDNGIFTVPQKAINALPQRVDWLEHELKREDYEDDFRFVAKYGGSKEKIPTECVAKISNAAGYEFVEFERLGSASEIYLNGEKIGDTLRLYGKQSRNSIRPYRFYCSLTDGENELKIVSMRKDFDAPAMSGYVKLGRRIKKQWSVKLHYGKARVFVRSKTPKKIKLIACIR